MTSSFALSSPKRATPTPIEEIFKVKVTNVNTLHRQGKTQRTRTGLGHRAAQKRAIVTVAQGQTIDIFGN